MSDKEREDKMMKGMDAFINAVTGAGYSHDSSTYTMFNRGGDLSEQLLEDLYIDHDLAATIVDRIVQDALRSGYEINWEGATDQERFDVVDWAEAEYGVTTEVQEARIYSRLFGGAGVFLGIEGALTSAAIPGAPVSFLRATPSSEIKGELFYGDPSQQNYGKVQTYRQTPLRLSQQQQLPPYFDIHESRIVPFYGIKLSDRQVYQDKGWGKSVLHRVYDLIKKFDSAFDSVLHTLAESSVPVYKVKALLDLLASENGELLAKRFELINTAKSAYRAVILDMDETYERVEASLSEASNVVTVAMVRLSGAAQMPSTLLFGMQPAGQNATGASDLENWNQQVASEQSLVLGPAIRRVYEMLLAQESSPLGASPKDLQVVFPAVETPSLQDQVNLYAQRAGADRVYFDMGAATAAEIAVRRAKEPGGQFPSVDLGHLKELDMLQKERLLDPPDPVMEESVATEPEAEPEPKEQEDSKQGFGEALGALLDGKDVEITY